MTSLEIFLITITVALAACLAAVGNYAVRLRIRFKQRGLFGSWPIRRVKLSAVDPVFTPNELGTRLATEVRFFANIDVPGGVSDLEAWVLAVLAKRSRSIFEFGTCSGRTTYLMAVNSPCDAEVTTLTLGPDQHGDYRSEAGDEECAVNAAIAESANSTFVYSETEAEAKITQLFVDSKMFDHSPWRGKCDLIFVDGSHAYSYVVSDTKKALEMVAPGGVVIWHDYQGPRRAKGVWKALNELAGELPLVHVAGTSLVVYRKA